MNIDYWAHWVVSVTALLASIGIPLWQWHRTNAQMIAGKRNLLLQSILSAKSNIYSSKWDYERIVILLDTRLQPDVLASITEKVAEMQELHDRLEALHKEWSDCNDGKGLKELERGFCAVDVISSDAKDMAKRSETIIRDIVMPSIGKK